MGSFSSLLGGLATGARDEYSKIDDQNRADKRAKDKSIAEAVLKDLQTNDQLTPDEQEHHFRTFLDLNGVKDKKVVDGLVNHSQYHRQKMAEFERQQGYTKQQPQLGGGQQVAPETTVGGDDGTPATTLPAMPMAPTGGLPQLPPPPEGFQPKTAGQLRFEESEPRVRQAEHDKQAAIRQEARDAAIGTIDDKLEILKKYNGTPMEAEVRQLVGAAPKGVGAKSRALAGTMSGAAVKKELEAQGKDASDINPTSSYRASVDADGKLLPDSIHETEQQTRAGAAALGSSWIKMFPKDAVGNPVNESAMYVPVRSVNGGNIVSIYPVSELGSSHAAQNFKTVQMKDGTTSLVPVTETSTTTKTVNGAPVQNTPGATPATAQVAGPPPTLGGPPPAQAAPAPVSPDARPTPGQPVPKSATPSSPLPKRSSAAVGAPISIPGAGKALTPKETEDNYKQFQSISTTANRVQQVLANADLFKSLASSGKIQLAMSPEGSLQVISRYSGMNEREKHVAALLTSLKEDINVLRGVYQATGFRGPEAFAALTALSGKPLGDPGVTIDLLKQTLESLNTQKDVISQTLKTHGLDIPTYTPPGGSSSTAPTKSLDDIFGKKK